MSYMGRSEFLYCPLCEQLEVIDGILEPAIREEKGLLERQGKTKHIAELEERLSKLAEQKETESDKKKASVELAIRGTEKALERLKALTPLTVKDESRLKALQSGLKPLRETFTQLERAHRRCALCGMLLGEGHEEETIKVLGDKNYCSACYKKTIR